MVELELGRLTGELDARLAGADADLARHYPGPRAARQPVHTVYVPADRFAADTVGRYGALALDLLGEHEAVFLELVGGDRDLVA
ncbi:MAG: aldolase, partial [Nocardioidaceae bacterium]|nr:aldolase [Nocardioidaceae bacterium]